jgi:hypothetical protein
MMYDGAMYEDDDDEMDEEEEEELMSMMMNGVGGFFGGLGNDEYFPPTTWDLVTKNLPKLPQLDLLLHKYQNQIKNRKFFTQYNDSQYNPPFLIFYSKHLSEESSLKAFKDLGHDSKESPHKKGQAEQQSLTLANFNKHLLIPHQYELMKFFENFHMMNYPKEPILMLRRKCTIFF